MKYKLRISLEEQNSDKDQATPVPGVSPVLWVLFSVWTQELGGLRKQRTE